MKARAVVGNTVLRWLYKILCHSLTRVVGVVLLAAVLFQALPQSPETGAKSAAPSPPSIGELVLHAMSPVTRHLPSLFGLWDVQAPRGVIVDSFPRAEEIVEEARRILPLLDELAETKFFRIFKIDLGQECPFWARADLCSSPTGSCAVCECTPDQIPLPWKQKPIEHFVDRRLYEQEEVSPWLDPRNTGLGLPGAAGEAETGFLDLLSGQASDQSSYVDLSLNPPGFTAYKGRNIWGLIYKENCLRDNGGDGVSGAETAFSTTAPGQCTEEEFFEKMISGLQTAIMTLASEYNAPLGWSVPIPLSAKTRANQRGQLAPRHFYNLDLFRWRVAPNRQWIENLYLDFSLLLRTLSRVSGVVESCPCYTGTEVEDSHTKGRLTHLLEVVQQSPSGDARRFPQALFQRKQALAIQQFTNISRIFDCIECEKCRLHGKVKLAALQVAVKAGSNAAPVRSLERNEITALLNALRYFGDAVLIVAKMQRRVRVLRSLFSAACALALLAALHALGLTARLLATHTTDPTLDTTDQEPISLGALVQEIDRENKKKQQQQTRNLRQRAH
eukprot:Gregarina_sp_Pseudo_9__210@NODE_1137_length_1848_cov_97_808734_g1064_i0_p1_GENE_NODE_1137_length_1848_cov_97_808734_g1064_i0NODE_1137_length_1848_cov_97_808734_g1064_i0_p1_ORF_typecomplete_len576_score201_94ERO1/PF04137_15/3e81CbtA/PF09490_10/17CbtA/PF09490_10/3_3_NODE_1137_length_1848_cov_97_808734_g1064_i0491728